MKRALACMLLAAALCACDQNMEQQPAYRSYSEAPLFRGGAMRAPPPGTVARDQAERERHAREQPPLTRTLLARGHDRFTIYCAPCHGQTGAGNGIVVQRGMPHPTSYHDPRLRKADDQHFFDVITNGYGAMYSYAARVDPADRWAIIAYIRALQLSRHATLNDAPDDERQKLEAKP
jgi:mono/diheme cytochrome c family protein